MIVDLTAATFDEVVLGNDLPVLVDLWAPWCGPCRAMEPVLEALAAARAGSLVVAKVNVDDEPGLAARLNVTGVPTLLVYSGGELRAQMVGARGQAALEAEIDATLAA